MEKSDKNNLQQELLDYLRSFGSSSSIVVKDKSLELISNITELAKIKNLSSSEYSQDKIQTSVKKIHAQAS